MKISLLFLTYENPLHEYFWKEKGYLDNLNCEIIIHAKYQNKITEPWISKLSKYNIETSWGSENIIIATLLLLEQAYINGSDWFLLCSEDSFPLMDFNQCQNFLENNTLSMFDLIDPELNKTSQWFALNRNDVGLLFKAINKFTMDNSNVNESIKNKEILNKTKYLKNIYISKLFDNIVKKIPKNKAIDELFFLSAFKKINPNYEYLNYKVHYVKWYNNYWISKHPTIFNKLLITDKNDILNKNPIFIRKTLPTFNDESNVEEKKNAIVIIIGTENLNKEENYYDSFINKLKSSNNYDLFLLVMIDNIKNINYKLTEECIQIYSVVYNDVDNAIYHIKDFIQIYENILIIKENDNINMINLNTDENILNNPSNYILPTTPSNSPPSINETNITEKTNKINDDDKFNTSKSKNNKNNEENNKENNEEIVMESLREYYRLKKNYEKKYYDKYVYKIINSKKSKAKKKELYNKLLKPQCINCKQNVGTIFERKYYEEYNDKFDVVVFTAKCGDILNPCDLNIEIHRSARESYSSMIDEIKQKINKTQLDIILLKNKTLFLDGKNKNDEYLKLFEELREKIKEEYSILTKLNEENTFINDNPDEIDELNNLISTLNQDDILNFKKKINEYLTKGDEESLKNAIKNYIDDINTKIMRIRQLKYKIMYVSYDEKNKIHSLIQDKYSYDGKHFYDSLVDEVVSFVKGNKLKKESTKLNLKNEQTQSIEEEKTNKNVRGTKSNKSNTLKNNSLIGKNITKPKTLKKRLVLFDESENKGNEENEESKGEIEKQTSNNNRTINTEIIFKPDENANINESENSTKIIRRKIIIDDDKDENDEDEDENGEDGNNNEEKKGGSNIEMNKHQNIQKKNIQEEKNKEQQIGKIKRYNKNIILNQAS